ncbi:hypothetical protein B5F14_06650 [Faecalitalea cylindroides]|uniref:Uncharacterized protein n=1 Tax=Faecalitalea cylindroides TaxID=39483 RepID=A0A1Y4LYB6_9FIRM|nr:hypothetical protein [Faecalitalea cylindroides]OUP60091.1 hypothetical protein B5F14_06650 [Faecalitalea cylindroides]
MAQKKYLGETTVTYLMAKIKSLFVAKEAGKGLSTNDFTNQDKSKLDGLQNYTLPKAGSETLGGIMVGAGLTIDGEGHLSATGGGEADSVNWENVVGKPTAVSEFENDSGYQTASDVESKIIGKGYQTSAQVDEKLTAYAKKSDIASALKYKGSKNTYSELPSSDQSVGDVWNVVQADSSHNIKAGDNVAWNGSSWDVLSGTVDLSGYVQDSDLVEITTGEIDSIIESLA